MRQLRIVLWLAVIFAGTAFGQGAKTVPAASAPQAQASTQTTVAAMVDRDISAVEKQVVEATEAMPEEKFNFTPETLNIPGDDYKGVRSFAVQVKHIVRRIILFGRQLPAIRCLQTLRMGTVQWS